MPTAFRGPKLRNAIILLVACALTIFSVQGAQARDGQINLYSDGNSTMVIQQPGSYVLVSDVVMLNDMTGILVDASNVTIDLNGHRLRGASSTSAFGVQVASGHNDVTIRNGTIQNFGYGVRGLGRTVAEDLRILDCGFFGISIGGSDNRVADCVVRLTGGAPDGVPNSLGDLPGRQFRGGITAGLRTLVTNCVVGGLLTTSGADLIGVAVGDSGKVDGCVVSNLSAAGGVATGIQAGVGSLIDGCVISSIISAESIAEGVAVATRSTVRDTTVTSVSGIAPHGIIGRELAQAASPTTAEEVTVDGCVVDGIEEQGGGDLGETVGIWGGARLRVVNSRVADVDGKEGSALGIYGMDSATVERTDVADIAGFSVEVIGVGRSSAIVDCTLSDVIATGDSFLYGIHVGPTSRVARTSLSKISSTSGAEVSGVFAATGSRVEACTLSDLSSAGKVIGVRVDDGSEVGGCTVQDLASTASGVYGVFAGAFCRVRSNTVGSLAAPASLAGQAYGIRAHPQSTIEDNSVNYLAANRVVGIFPTAADTAIAPAARRPSMVRGNSVSALIKTGNNAEQGVPSGGVVVDGQPSNIVDNVISDLVAADGLTLAPLFGIYIESNARTQVVGNSIQEIRGIGAIIGSYDTSGILLDIRMDEKAGALIADNSISGIYTHAQLSAGSGVGILLNTQRATVARNEISASSRGIVVLGAEDYNTHHLITENIIADAITGIVVKSNSNVIVKNTFLVTATYRGLIEKYQPDDVSYTEDYSSALGGNMNVVRDNHSTAYPEYRP